MARNIEIKACIDSIETLVPKAAAIADQGPIDIIQDDTFFRCDSGRLKLRAFSPEEGELIFYRRADRQGPKESFYLRSSTSAPDTLAGEKVAVGFHRIDHMDGVVVDIAQVDARAGGKQRRGV